MIRDLINRELISQRLTVLDRKHFVGVFASDHHLVSSAKGVPILLCVLFARCVLRLDNLESGLFSSICADDCWLYKPISKLCEVARICDKGGELEVLFRDGWKVEEAKFYSEDFGPPI